MIVRAGLKPADALCATYATVRARNARRPFASSDNTSTSPMRTDPPLIAQPARA
jgi:hypothetical protein